LSRCSFSFRLTPPPRSTLFPYTTLFRSHLGKRPSELGNSRRCGAHRCSHRGGDVSLRRRPLWRGVNRDSRGRRGGLPARGTPRRSEEHTSELQSLAYLVCRLLLEKKKAI